MGKKETIISKIKSLIAEIAFIDEDFSETAHLKKDLAIDSVSIIALILDLNNEFEVQIKSSEITEENFGNVKFIADFLMRKGRAET